MLLISWTHPRGSKTVPLQTSEFKDFFLFHYTGDSVSQSLGLGEIEWTADNV